MESQCALNRHGALVSADLVPRTRRGSLGTPLRALGSPPLSASGPNAVWAVTPARSSSTRRSSVLVAARSASRPNNNNNNNGRSSPSEGLVPKASKQNVNYTAVMAEAAPTGRLLRLVAQRITEGEVTARIYLQADRMCVTLTTDLAAPLLLHWSTDEWLQPAESVWPPGTDVSSESTVQTRMVELPAGPGAASFQSTAVFNFDLSEAPKGINFIFQNTATGRMHVHPDNGGAYHLSLPRSNTAEEGVRGLEAPVAIDPKLIPNILTTQAAGTIVKRKLKGKKKKKQMGMFSMFFGDAKPKDGNGAAPLRGERAMKAALAGKRDGPIQQLRWESEGIWHEMTVTQAPTASAKLEETFVSAEVKKSYKGWVANLTTARRGAQYLVWGTWKGVKPDTWANVPSDRWPANTAPLAEAGLAVPLDLKQYPELREGALVTRMEDAGDLATLRLRVDNCKGIGFLIVDEDSGLCYDDNGAPFALEMRDTDEPMAATAAADLETLVNGPDALSQQAKDAARNAVSTVAGAEAAAVDLNAALSEANSLVNDLGISQGKGRPAAYGGSPLRPPRSNVVSKEAAPIAPPPLPDRLPNVGAPPPLNPNGFARELPLTPEPSLDAFLPAVPVVPKNRQESKNDFIANALAFLKGDNQPAKDRPKNFNSEVGSILDQVTAKPGERKSVQPLDPNRPLADWEMRSKTETFEKMQAAAAAAAAGFPAGPPAAKAAAPPAPPAVEPELEPEPPKVIIEALMPEGVVPSSPLLPIGEQPRGNPYEPRPTDWNPGTGTGREVLLQGFNWESSRLNGGYYDDIRGKAGEIARMGFTQIWLPPPTDSVSEEGYMPRDLYNLNSKYGSEHQLRDAVRALRDAGLFVLGDAVLNHRCAQHQGPNGVWNQFGGKLAWDARAIVGDDPNFQGRGNKSSGDSFGAAPNIDHSQDFVRQDISEWMNWLKEYAGYDGWRLDYVRGFWGGHVKEYLEATDPYFVVGEYWDSLSYSGADMDYNQDAHRQRIINWINAAGGLAGAFDVTTKGILHSVFERNEFWRLADATNKPPGVMGWWPSRAVTFLENHDTGSTQGHWRFPGGKEAAGYAYLLTHPGTPTVFFDHVFHWGDGLKRTITELMALRTRQGLHCRSTLRIVKAEQNVYASITDERVALKLGNGHWEPGPGFEQVLQGDNFKVWERRV